MEQTKLTVRVPKYLLENIKDYAAKRNTTLTDLIEAYLKSIPDQSSEKIGPLTSRLIGILPAEAYIAEYRKHLEEKYGS